MALSVDDGTFYLVHLPDEKTLHNEENEAIDYLRNQSEQVDPESDDVSVLRVEVEGEDWTIAEMSWQTIALRIMGGE